MALRRESMAVEMPVADSPFQRAERVSESRSPAINQRFTEATGGETEQASQQNASVKVGHNENWVSITICTPPL